MESRPIHAIILQFASVNGSYLGTKLPVYRMKKGYWHALWNL